MSLKEGERLGWLSRFTALMEENPDAEIYIDEDDEITLSYGPDTQEEIGIGNRRKCHLHNLREHLADNDS